MKPPIIYTLLGCTVEIAPGGRTAKVTKPGQEPVEFTSIPGGATAQVRAQRWIHGIEEPGHTVTGVGWKLGVAAAEGEVQIDGMEPNATMSIAADVDDATEIDEDKE